jgi:ubiquinone/menaquinone biosynthesis C-methylase UbiE
MGSLGIERSPDIFAELRQNSFSRVIVLGSESINDFEEIVLTCFLTSREKLYLSSTGAIADIRTQWEPTIRPDFGPREVRAQRLNEEDARRYVWYFHKWLESEISASEYGPPQPIADRRPDVLIYGQPRLAQDLAQQTPDLDQEVRIADFRSSFSTFLMSDRTLVRSADYYRSMANFIVAVPGIESVLDVGCGSGLLACHLAGSGRFSKLMGVDAAAPRVSGAKYHARLSGIDAAQFHQMSMDRLEFDDGSFDAVVSSYALEQSGESLGRAIAELRRVARKFLVLFETTSEYFSTFASQWHIPKNGWANRYFSALSEVGVSYAVRPALFSHYFNTGSVFVVDLRSDRNPVVSLPHLFRPDPRDWPGGARIA